MAEDSAPLVLVVEDDVHIATVLRTYLEADGYRVDIVPDGQQAIEAARRLSPFAITLDISLPKLDGWSVLNALKREAATTDIPVVIVSMLDERPLGLSLGAAEFITKPVDRTKLVAILADTVGHVEGTALVVEDQSSDRELVSHMLTSIGLTVAFVLLNVGSVPVMTIVLPLNAPPAATARGSVRLTPLRRSLSINLLPPASEK